MVLWETLGAVGFRAPYASMISEIEVDRCTKEAKAVEGIVHIGLIFCPAKVGYSFDFDIGGLST